MIVKSTISSLIFFCVMSSFATAEPYQIANSEVRQLTSKSNGVDYSLYISLPKGYEKGKIDYPVVFTLDADYSFALAHNIVEHLSDRNNLPKMIVVGIGYPGKGLDAIGYRLNRTRDYTPTYVATGGYGPQFQKHSGGASQFTKFIDQELIPFMVETYGAGKNDRTIVGHSFGGLFASYVLQTRADLFQRYIIVSPSLWYDNNKLFEIQEKFAEDNTRLDAKVFLAVGSEEEQNGRPMITDLITFYERLKIKKYQGLSINKRIFKDETHNTVFPTALTSGLVQIFKQK